MLKLNCKLPLKFAAGVNDHVLFPLSCSMPLLPLYDTLLTLNWLAELSTSVACANKSLAVIIKILSSATVYDIDVTTGASFTAAIFIVALLGTTNWPSDTPKLKLAVPL